MRLTSVWLHPPPPLSPEPESPPPPPHPSLKEFAEVQAFFSCWLVCKYKKWKDNLILIKLYCFWHHVIKRWWKFGGSRSEIEVGNGCNLHFIGKNEGETWVDFILRYYMVFAKVWTPLITLQDLFMLSPHYYSLPLHSFPSPALSLFSFLIYKYSSSTSSSSGLFFASFSSCSHILTLLLPLLHTVARTTIIVQYLPTRNILLGHSHPLFTTCTRSRAHTHKRYHTPAWVW